MLKGSALIPLLVVVATTAPLAAAQAQLSPDWTRCVNEGKQFSPDAAISGCTAVNNSGKGGGRNLAVAYNNRGIAYRDKGDLDRALVDFSEAIEVDSKYVMQHGGW